MIIPLGILDVCKFQMDQYVRTKLQWCIQSEQDVCVVQHAIRAILVCVVQEAIRDRLVCVWYSMQSWQDLCVWYSMQQDNNEENERTYSMDWN